MTNIRRCEMHDESDALSHHLEYNGWKGNEGYIYMNARQSKRLGAHLRRKRRELGMTTRRLAERCGCDRVTIVRLEAGAIQQPDAARLMTVAKVLELDPADVLTRAGYPVPTTHLAPSTYLRTKYSNLGETDLDALQRDVAAVLKRHGIDPSSGPSAGEDEE